MTGFKGCIRLVLAAGSLCLCVCACSFFAPEEQSGAWYYDLEQPERLPLQTPVDVAIFSSAANERFRMAIRENKVMFRSSDKNRWSQTPGMLLTRYLRIAFRSGEKDLPADSGGKVHLKGEVLSFNTDGKYAEMAVCYTLQYRERSVSKTVLLREKMKDFSPEGFASAMSRASSRFATIIQKESTLLSKGQL